MAGTSSTSKRGAALADLRSAVRIVSPAAAPPITGAQAVRNLRRDKPKLFGVESDIVVASQEGI
jgi:hypothetical protein